jgi:hypothetical protein
MTTTKRITENIQNSGERVSNEFNICANQISAKVHYNKGLLDYDVSKLVDIKSEMVYFKNTDNYIRGFIEYMKTNIIKKLPNLNAVKIYLATLDESKIIIRFMVKISNIIQDILRVRQKVSFRKSIFVYITYENVMVFNGIIDFTGLD